MLELVFEYCILVIDCVGCPSAIVSRHPRRPLPPQAEPSTVSQRPSDSREGNAAATRRNGGPAPEGEVRVLVTGSVDVGSACTHPALGCFTA